MDKNRSIRDENLLDVVAELLLNVQQMSARALDLQGMIASKFLHSSPVINIKSR